MKPQSYLNDLAKSYFTVIAKILESRGMANDAFNIELSMLSNEYAKYESAVKEMNTKGYYTTSKTGWEQISPCMTVQKNAIDTINKLSPKFGLTPADFEKIKDAVKKEEKGDDLTDLMNG